MTKLFISWFKKPFASTELYNPHLIVSRSGFIRIDTESYFNNKDIKDQVAAAKRLQTELPESDDKIKSAAA